MEKKLGESESYDVDYIDGLIVAFGDELRGRAPSLVTRADADGLRLGVATALLFRGLELLDAARACEDAPLRPAAELLMRSAIEVTLRGRYLLVGPHRNDEYARLLGDYLHRGEALSETTGVVFGGVAPWVLHVVQPSTNQPRDLASLAKALDKLSGRKATSRWSAEYLYECLYRWLSNSAEHAGLAAVGRFVERHDVVNASPDPLSTARWHVVIAGQLGELAWEVYRAHGVPTDALSEIGVSLPEAEQP